jgi:hypothetical protein
MADESLLARIQGTVMDSRSAAPWAGVEIFVRGTTCRTRTDENGRYDLPCRWQTRTVTVVFLAPSRMLERRVIASKDIVVDRGDVVTVDVETDALQFADPPCESIDGEFHGHFSWGFEESSFRPDGSRIPAPDGSLRSIEMAWVHFVGRARDNPFKWNTSYRVKWVGKLTGPGAYGHMGGSVYSMEVSEVLEWREEGGD